MPQVVQNPKKIGYLPKHCAWPKFSEEITGNDDEFKNTQYLS